EILRYFERRRQQLDVVMSTRTPTGQILDWVPIESQLTAGSIAHPPSQTKAAPDSEDLPPGVMADPLPVAFELVDASVKRGPRGTVPIVRKDFSRIHATTSLQGYLAKRNKSAKQVGPVAQPKADPDPFGYFHATNSNSIECFGAQAVLNVWD